jgi:ubiquinone/menaquinone biosynthesis C-methylase UbiE
VGEIAQGSEIVVAAGPGREPLRRLAQTHRVPFVEAAGNGYGEILGAALSHSRGDYLLTMDADYSHKPDYARAMWEHRHSGEFLVGSRYLSGSYLEVGLARRLMSRAVNAFYRRALSLPFSDITSGFRMFPRRLLEDIGYPEAKGLDVLPEMLTKAVCRGWRVAEVPIWYQGTGPLSRARAARLGLGYARTLTGLLGLRNSVRAADYDSRAFDSVIPLQRYWQRRRFGIAHDFASGAGSLLDVGCGTSRIIQSIPGAVGVDVAIAKLRWLRGPGRRLAQADVSRLPFKDECFDAVICSEVIEHVPREEIRLEEMIRVIHPGGTLILGTPDYGTRTWRALEWLYNRLFPLGYTGEHVNPYTFQGLSQELRALGLEILDCRYVGGGEMIFKARVPPSKHGSPHRPGDDRVESLAGR